jgi:hypothetical protein
MTRTGLQLEIEKYRRFRLEVMNEEGKEKGLILKTAGRPRKNGEKFAW